MKKKKTINKRPVNKKPVVDSIWTSKSNTIIDLGCGENKRQGAIGVDFRKMNGVDVVQNLALYPWKNIPDEVADVVTTSHLLEHINPASSDPRLAGLLDLMLEKGLISKKEVEEHIGDYNFLGGFIRFCDEVWRILKPGGQFISTFPYAGSFGYWQDPTHINAINHVTMAYFDPLAKDSAGNLYNLYTIYRPMPFKILNCFYDTNGFIEIAMEKRIIDPSYRVTKDNGMSA